MLENHPEPQQNFFLLIPSTVANDPRLSDSEKLLFGRIAGLSNQKGYCWASNKYLGELSGVTEGEISKRIKKLKDFGYLRVETTKRGFAWFRKVYPNFNHEGFIQTVREDHTEHSAGSYGLHTNISNNNIRKQQQPAAAAAVFSCLKNLEIPEKEKEWITENHTEPHVEHAVKFVTHSSTNIKESLSQALKWACDKARDTDCSQPQPKISEEDVKNKNQEYIKNLKLYDGAEKGGFRVDIGNSDITFVSKENPSFSKIYTANSKSFISDVKEFWLKL